MLGLIANLAVSLRTATRTDYEYVSMIEVVAGRNALHSGKLALARQYFERAIPVFERLAEESGEDPAAWSDLMSTNACLIDTLQRLCETVESADVGYATQLADAQKMQSMIAQKLETRACASEQKFATRHA